MPTTHDKLEALFAKVRALPQATQERVAEALVDLTQDEPCLLSDEERAVLMTELEGARRREFASQSDVDAVLHRPWVKAPST